MERPGAFTLFSAIIVVSSAGGSVVGRCPAAIQYELSQQQAEAEAEELCLSDLQ